MAGKVSYVDDLDSDVQIAAEERIASTIFSLTEEVMSSDEDCVGLSEEDCQELGCEILYQVLREFRPDLFVDGQGGHDPIRGPKKTIEPNDEIPF